MLLSTTDEAVWPLKGIKRGIDGPKVSLMFSFPFLFLSFSLCFRFKPSDRSAIAAQRGVV